LGEGGGDFMIRKEALIVLVTFCLTAALFSIISVGSQGAREYDPWYDINDDGKIDLKDYYGVGLKYATAGDPTKNVAVTNWPTNELAYNVTTSISASGWHYTPWISINEYSKVSICLSTNAVNNRFTVQTRHIGSLQVFYVETLDNVNDYFVKTYDAPNEQIRLSFNNKDASAADLRIDIYLIP
jgi:hypothetical protein